MGSDETTRDQVLATIERFPGIHFREIVRHLGTSTALVGYHIEALERDGEVRAFEVEGFTRYFPVTAYKALTVRERRVLHVLRQQRPLEIALLLLEHGALQHRELHRMLGGAKGTLTYHIHKLVDVGVVEKVARGDERGFHLKDPDEVRGILARYEPVPEVLADIHDVWDDLFSGHRRRGR